MENNDGRNDLALENSFEFVYLPPLSTDVLHVAFVNCLFVVMM